MFGGLLVGFAGDRSHLRKPVAPPGKAHHVGHFWDNSLPFGALVCPLASA